MQQLVRMNLAQAVEQAGEQAANEAFRDFPAMRLDEFLKGAAVLVLHHHVHGFIGAEEIKHANHVRVRQAGQGAAFLEEALHAVAEGALVIGRDQRLDFPFAAQGEAVGQIFLDRDTIAFAVGRQIDDRKTAQRKLTGYRVFLQLVAGG